MNLLPAPNVEGAGTEHMPIRRDLSTYPNRLLVRGRRGHDPKIRLCKVRCESGAKDIWPCRSGRATVTPVSAVLIAEPEAGVRGFLERHLAQDGFDVVGTEDRDSALELASRAHPALVLLGDPSALDAFPDVPVIVIGGEDSDAVDRVRAFARGCDDFVARPFVYDELVARMHAVLRRVRPAEPERLQAGPISVEYATRRVCVDGARVDLAGKEYELLVKLAPEPYRVFTKEELLREVWDFRSLGRTRTLDSHASRLRRKLQAVAPGPFVVNVWRICYKLLD
jgi:DNA-binding response OmpR family regulator